QLWHRLFRQFNKEVWRRGKDSNLRVARTTAASKPATALTNGNLSVSYSYSEVLTWPLFRDVLRFYRIDASDSQELAQMIAGTDQNSHEPMLAQNKCKRQGGRVHTDGNQRPYNVSHSKIRRFRFHRSSQKS